VITGAFYTSNTRLVPRYMHHTSSALAIAFG